VKNFQYRDDEEVIFNFGKYSTNEFIADFKAPFSDLKAFMVALASF